MDEMTERTGVCRPTLYNRIHAGKINARKESSQHPSGIRLIHADGDTFDAIRKWRQMPGSEKAGLPMRDFRTASDADLQTP